MSLQTLRYSWDNSTSEFCGMTICVIRSSMEKLSNRLGAYAYTANPDMNSTFGMTVSPVFGSNGGRMSYFANTLAMTSQIVEWAKWIPGHILQCIVFEIWIKLSSQLRAHGPSSKTEYLCWFESIRIECPISFEESFRFERVWVSIIRWVMKDMPMSWLVGIKSKTNNLTQKTYHTFYTAWSMSIEHYYKAK